MILYISVVDSNNVQTRLQAQLPGVPARQLGSCRAEHTKETIQRSTTTSADWFESLEATEYAVAAASSSTEDPAAHGSVEELAGGGGAPYSSIPSNKRGKSLPSQRS